MRPTAAIVAVLIVSFVSACGTGESRTAGTAGTSGSSGGSGAQSSSTQPPPPAPMTFDCGKPANKAQQLVCDDPQLSALDRRVQAAYQQALARPGADAATLTTAQGAFATVRDGCAGFSDLRTCVLEAYQTRQVELALEVPNNAAPPVVTYNCPADAGTLTAQFYNDFDPKTAVLDWKGVRVILFLQPSGSGARYGRQGSEYWEHQGEVSLDMSGTKFVCHTQP